MLIYFIICTFSFVWWHIQLVLVNLYGSLFITTCNKIRCFQSIAYFFFDKRVVQLFLKLFIFWTLKTYSIRISLLFHIWRIRIGLFFGFIVIARFACWRWPFFLLWIIPWLRNWPWIGHRSWLRNLSWSRDIFLFSRAMNNFLKWILAFYMSFYI